MSAHAARQRSSVKCKGKEARWATAARSTMVEAAERIAASSSVWDWIAARRWMTARPSEAIADGERSQQAGERLRAIVGYTRPQLALFSSASLIWSRRA